MMRRFTHPWSLGMGCTFMALAGCSQLASHTGMYGENVQTVDFYQNLLPTSSVEQGGTTLHVVNQANQETICYSKDLFDHASEVMAQSSTRKFVIPLPVLKDPEKLCTRGEDGTEQPICDWQGNPKLGMGIVFKNETDHKMQGVQTDGSTVLIINQVTEAQEKAMHALLQEFMQQQGLGIGRWHTMEPTLEDLKKLLSDLQKVNSDIYDSTISYVQKRLDPQKEVISEQSQAGAPILPGIYHPKGTACQAICLFTGRTSRFYPTNEEVTDGAGNSTSFKEYAFLVRNSDGNDVRLVQPDVFLQTYTTLEGSQIKAPDCATLFNSPKKR